MKKLLVFTLLATMILTLCACGGSPHPHSDNNQVELAPKNGVFDAPDTFFGEWDIPSIRDISKHKEGFYSMPVYRIDTYAELLHLKNIVGMDLIGNEELNSDYCSRCGTSKSCAHEMYNEEFFKEASLLIGWHQYEGVVIPNLYNDNKEFAYCNVAHDGSITVELNGIPAEMQEGTNQQWILAAVPKETIQECESIVFLVELPTNDSEEDNEDEDGNGETGDSNNAEQGENNTEQGNTQEPENNETQQPESNENQESSGDLE